MSNSKKKQVIKAENPTARQLHAEAGKYVYYCETSAGSVHFTVDKDFGVSVPAVKLIKWLR